MVKWLYLCLTSPITVYIMAALSQMKGVYKMFNISSIDFKEYDGLYVEVSTKCSDRCVNLMKTKASENEGVFIATFENLSSNSVELVQNALDIADDMGVPLKILS